MLHSKTYIIRCLKVAVLLLCGALSDERMGLQFAVQSLNGPSHAEPVTILCFTASSETPQPGAIKAVMFLFVCLFNPKL
jgi:hypothetical protein